MSQIRLFPVCRLSLALALCALLAVGSLAAPVPKGTAKPTESEIAVTAATDDKETMAKNETSSTNNLKLLILAAHSYHDSNGFLPGNITDTDGKMLLSWRVQLLPYLEEEKLYKQFRLDQPWDCEDNLKLLDQMPKVLLTPRVAAIKAGFTVYQGFVGPGALFEVGKKLSIVSITDGTSNTIMAAESSLAVPWTKPSDMPFLPDKDLPDFGKAYGARPLVALCDGSVRIVDTKKVSVETLKAAITIAGGEVLGADW